MRIWHRPVYIIHRDVLAQEAGSTRARAQGLQEPSARLIGKWVREIYRRSEVAIGGRGNIRRLAEALCRANLVLPEIVQSVSAADHPLVANAVRRAHAR